MGRRRGAVLRGRAEGGLLAALSYSRHPERWRAVVAESPRADLLTTLCDPVLPRPLGARQEWGDPAAERATTRRCRRSARTSTRRRRRARRCW